MRTIAIATPIRDKLGVMSPQDVVPYLNFLVYGEPGAGKTRLAATAQDHEDTRPLLFLDIEGGVTTIRKRKDVDVIKVRDIKTIEKVHNELFMDKSGYYKSVVLDSITELQKLDMRTVMKEQYDKKPETTDMDVPSQREWGKSGERMRRIIRAYRDLPVNTIVTALLGSEFSDDTGITSYFPSMPGKLRGEIPGYFDVVGYLNTKMENGSVVRTLQLSKTRRVVAKDRTDSLGDILDNPTVPMMWELIHNGS